MTQEKPETNGQPSNTENTVTLEKKLSGYVDKMKDMSRTKKEKPVSYYARFLSRAVLLEEIGPPPAVVSCITVISLFVIGALAWSAVTKLDETTVAQGAVMPASSVQPVQHLEGGIVSEVLVRNGELINKGQTLVRLAPTATLSERDRAAARHAALDMQITRLKSFALGQAADFSNYESQYPSLVRDQKDILAQQNSSLDAQREVVLAQISEQKNELKVLAEQEKTQKTGLDIISEEVKIRQELVDKGLGSKLRLLEVQRNFNKAQGDLQNTQTRRASVLANIREAEGSLEELGAKLKNEALNQMGSLSKELAEVSSELNRLQDKVSRLNITAPSSGIVKGLQYRSAGAVIPPGGVVAEIVPNSDSLVAEVRISPRDVGHVQVGEDVLVKVDTYNFARFGGISGTLNHVSASSFIDEQGENYFRGIVELPQNFIGPDPQSNRITAGMTVIADIKTGEKTLLQYLVKPINNALNTSFRER